jgi:hypothetical protein
MEPPQTIVRLPRTPGERARDAFRLTLEPLFVWWDDRRDGFGWRLSPDGEAAFAPLPFGMCVAEFTREDGDTTVVRFVLRVTRDVRLHGLDVRYRTTFAEPDFAWVPHLRPGEGLVIADQIFRSPALVLRRGAQGVALIPDLAQWPRGVKTMLDLDRRAPDGSALLAHGLGDYATTGHIFFKRKTAGLALAAGDEVAAAHYLLRLDGPRDPLARVAAFIWERFARRDGPAPLALPLARYEALACARIFAPDLYRTFAVDGRPVAAMNTQTLTSRRKPGVLDRKGVDKYLAGQRNMMKALQFVQAKIFTRPLGHKLLTQFLHSGRLKVAPAASFQAWFNQVRTALGSWLHARRMGDDELARRAEAIVELALCAPTEDGCPAATCFFPEGQIRWIRGTRAFEMIDAYHLPDAATTGFHLLEWHECARPDERILTRARELARLFLKLQDDAGAFPGWAKPTATGWAIDDDLRRSAMTAAPAMFLARLHRVEPAKEYAAAVRAALAFLEREVLPHDKWFDYELFYSCAGRPTGRDGPDPYTGVLPANTFSMFWAARAALDLHFAERDAASLATARRCVDRLSMQQQAFANPRLSLDSFGGFGVMNADAEFNDARQGVFAPLYFDMHRATGEAAMFARGVAALRACFTTMLVEENRAVAPGNMKNFRPSDRGAILENYAHVGRDEVTAGYLSPDWGCGTALYASGLAFREWGQAFADPANAQAFALDRCRARFVSYDGGVVAIEAASDELTELEIVVAVPVKELLVNGRPAAPVDKTGRRFRARLGGA